MTSSIIPQELSEIQKADRLIDMIDVRTPAEFREVHVLDPDQLRVAQAQVIRVSPVVAWPQAFFERCISPWSHYRDETIGASKGTPVRNRG